ncbi:thiol:disulfide interchange protein [Streptomyces sp. V4I8]
MTVLVLVGVLLLAVGGCVCVVWASRGAPRWVCVVATVTLAAGAVVRWSGRSGRGSSSSSDSDD